MPWQQWAGKDVHRHAIAAPPTKASPTPIASSSSLHRAPHQSRKVAIQNNYGQLPLHFEANRGQTDPQVQFLARGKGYSLFLTATEAVLALRQPVAPMPDEAENNQDTAGTVLCMQLVGANPVPQLMGLEALPGKGHYFLGNDPGKWRTNIPTYTKVRYEGVYPGIDLIYYGNQRYLEYDFIIAPGADHTAITLGFKGADRLNVDAQGDLMLHTAGGHVRLHKPLIYQEVDGVRQHLAGGYVRKGLQQIGIQVGAYDTMKPLVIDPVLVYSTYLGGSGEDRGSRLTVDAFGYAYVTGRTFSSDFPVTANAFQPAHAGGPDAFVTKLTPAGDGLVYSTYLGGGSSGAPLCCGAADNGYSIAVDTNGNAIVGGNTDSNDFLVTAGAFQTAPGGGGSDAFVAKLSADGAALLYSTYLGGGGSDRILGIAGDAVGNVYITGFTGSPNFPTTVGAFQTAYAVGESDGFVAKLSADGAALVYATFLGSSNKDASTDLVLYAGQAFVVGTIELSDSQSLPLLDDFPTTIGAFQTTIGGGAKEAFIAKLNAAGSALVFATYFGGSGDDSGSGITLDPIGQILVTGSTNSPNFPTVNPLQPIQGGAFDAFITIFTVDGSALVYSTYLGGSSDDSGVGIAVDLAGHAYITGFTESAADFPTVNPFQASFGGGTRDAFVAKLGVDEQGPVTSAVVATPSPVTVNTAVTLTAHVDDTTTGGSIIEAAEYSIDDSSLLLMDAQDGAFDTVSEDVEATIPAFTAADVHEICVLGTDAANNIGPEECILLAVFDPTAGFVTSGGWLQSPEGAYTPDPLLTGKANFGFVSKYQKGANTPTGVTEFQFKVANLNFHSGIYDWLVVAGARAQFKGTGTINNSGNYGLLLTAIDGQIPGGGGVDKFRIKIWDTTTEVIVYDNKLGASDTGNDATELGGGSIVIHKK